MHDKCTLLLLYSVRHATQQFLCCPSSPTGTTNFVRSPFATPLNSFCAVPVRQPAPRTLCVLRSPRHSTVSVLSLFANRMTPENVGKSAKRERDVTTVVWLAKRERKVTTVVWLADGNGTLQQLCGWPNGNGTLQQSCGWPNGNGTLQQSCGWPNGNGKLQQSCGWPNGNGTLQQLCGWPNGNGKLQHSCGWPNGNGALQQLCFGQTGTERYSSCVHIQTGAAGQMRAARRQVPDDRAVGRRARDEGGRALVGFQGRRTAAYNSTVLMPVRVAPRFRVFS